MINVGDRFARVDNSIMPLEVVYGPFPCHDGEKTVPTVQLKNQAEVILEITVERLLSEIYMRVE